MYGIRIRDGFIDFGGTEYSCPHCQQKHEDAKGKMIDKCNNKGFAKTQCRGCKRYFYVSYDMKGEFVTFLNPNKTKP